MKRNAIILSTVMIAASITTGCHFFDDPEDDFCPLNSGYPCACSITMEEFIASGYSNQFCGDGSRCLWINSDPSRGFCTIGCDSFLGDECNATKGWGASPAMEDDFPGVWDEYDNYYPPGDFYYQRGACVWKDNAGNGFCGLLCASDSDCTPGSVCNGNGFFCEPDKVEVEGEYW